MLTELHISDFAIIDELHLFFAPGFTALTGETGAGKSILIDAVELVLGGRADRTFVRAGADQALVEATFRLSPARRAALRPFLEREGLEGDEPDLLLLGREVRAEGRSVCRVNGRAVTLTLLQEIAEGLVDIHGQSEHLSLLRVREHAGLLDRYADLWDLRGEVGALVTQVRAVRRERLGLERNERELAQRMDLLQYQIEEISAAKLKPGEEEELSEERIRLANAEQLASLLDEGLQMLDEGSERNPAAVDLVGSAARALEELARIDPALGPMVREIEEAIYRLQDVAQSMRDYREQVEHNPRRLTAVEERVDLIQRLKRKYGSTISDILAYAERAAEELETITHSEERIVELRAEEERLLEEVGARAADLSRRRRAAAQGLARAIERELEDLRMEGARFGVHFQWKEDAEGAMIPAQENADSGSGPVSLTEVVTSNWEEGATASALRGRLAFDASGIDQIEFLVSPNPGEPLKPLAKIASGGETSRLMLALKTVLSRVDETPTLVFDEIDQGIGGRVGATVGEKLWALTMAHGKSTVPHQVLCVTHLPQLAGFGDAHLRVEKEVVENRTVTQVNSLQGAARVEELAQMLGASGESAYRSAEEILQQVGERKEALRDGSQGDGGGDGQKA